MDSLNAAMPGAARPLRNCPPGFGIPGLYQCQGLVARGDKLKQLRHPGPENDHSRKDPLAPFFGAEIIAAIKPFDRLNIAEQGAEVRDRFGPKFFALNTCGFELTALVTTVEFR